VRRGAGPPAPLVASGQARPVVAQFEVEGRAKAGGKNTTPAMAAGVARAPWSLTQLAELLDEVRNLLGCV
jgi:hypothetical protein